MTRSSLIYFFPGSQSRQEFLLPDAHQGQTISIGSTAGNQLIVEDSAISPQHALVLLDPLGLFILDLNTVNGVVLNGQRIKSNDWVPIFAGDILQMGNTVFNLVVEESASRPVVQENVPVSFPAYQPNNVAPPVLTVQKKKASPVWLIGGVLFLLIALGAIVLWLGRVHLSDLLKSGSSGGILAGNKQITITADGQVHSDSNNVSIFLPTGALVDSEAQFTSSSLSQELENELRGGYQLLSPAYSLTAVDQVDGLEPGLLAFQADQDDLILLSIIDGTYVAELEVAPENGKLTLPVDVRAPNNASLSGTNVMWQQGTIQYMLAKPKMDDSAMVFPSKKIAGRLQQTTPYSCFSLFNSRCWQNGNGSVQLMMDKDISLTPTQSNSVITYVQSVMDKYEALGFDGAIYTASNPVQVVVTKGAGTPHYQVTNGVIYLPNDIASRIASGGKDDFLVHEMAHWIQDESYNMTAAYYFGADTWWLEVAAENMVMLVDPVYVSTNLLSYGQIDADEKASVLQNSPYQWPMGEFYVQAQQVKVNMCSNGTCPISQESFVNAVNNGTYPFSDEALQTKLHENLPDYARYLLGVAPEKANSSIPLEGVLNSEGYGDYVVLKRTVRSALDMKDQSGFGRLFTEEKAGQAGLLIEAGLQKDGVYVLRVEVASGDMSPQWPAALYIEAGAPYYYRLNDGDIQFNDGKKELVIQPLMAGSNKAITQVRIVAVGQQGGEVFKAHIGAADLSGMWVVELADKSDWLDHLTCENMDETAIVSDWGVPITTFLLMFGDFVSDPISNSLTWSPKAERASILPESMIEKSGTNSGSSFTADAGIDEGIIHLNVSSYTAEKTTFEVRPEAYSTQFISLPGTISAKGDFDHLEYVGSEEAILENMPNFLAWKLSGRNLIYTFDSDLLDQEVNQSAQLESETRNHCTGTIEAPGVVKIYQQH